MTPRKKQEKAKREEQRQSARRLRDRAQDATCIRDEEGTDSLGTDVRNKPPYGEIVDARSGIGSVRAPALAALGLATLGGIGWLGYLDQPLLALLLALMGFVFVVLLRPS